MGASAKLGMLHHFVVNLETIKADDADEFIATLPDLALLKS